MRENSAVHGDGDSRRAGSTALLPIVLVAIAVLVLALVVRGSRTGTIVVAKTVVSATTTQDGRTSHTAPFSTLEITETSPDGVEQRLFTSNTFSRAGFQLVVAGQRFELYDPLDHTIFATTQAAEQRAVDAQTALSQAGITSSFHAYRSFVPGRRSVFDQQLLAHQYRVAGRVTIAGRPALRLVPVTTINQLRPGRHSTGSYASLGTAYVSPGTYDPIQEVNRTRLAGIMNTAIVRWQSYRVLPATSANQRLLSLIARHPHARIVDNTRALLRAAQSERGSPGTLGIKNRQTPRGATSG